MTSPLAITELHNFQSPLERERQMDWEHVFLEDSLQTIFNCIKRRSFLKALDAMASTVHLKMKDHNDSKEPVARPTHICEARLIHETMLKISRGQTHLREEKKEYSYIIHYLHHLNVRGDEVL